VRANIGVSGESYAKYGTTFDIQLLVIDKVEHPKDALPLLEEVRNARPQPTIEKTEDLANRAGGDGQAQDSGVAAAAGTPENASADSAVAVGGGGHQRNEGQRADGVGRTGVPVDDQSHAGDKNTGRPGRGGKDINAPDAGGRDNVAGHRAGDIGNGERNDSAVRLDKSENAEAGSSPTRFSSLALPRRSRWRARAAADLTETAFSTSASGR